MAKWAAEHGAWEVRRRADVVRVLADPATFTAAGSLPAPPVPLPLRDRLGPAYPWTIPSLVNDDSPAHAPLRKRVNRVFRRSRVVALAPEISATAARLVDALHPDGTADLLAAFARPLAEESLAVAIGFDQDDLTAVRRWLPALDVTLAPEGDVSDTERLDAAREHAGFAELCARRLAAARGDDLFAQLRDVPVPVAISALMQTVMAGVATTAHLIAHATRLALEHPGCWAQLAAEPDRAGAVVEEALRHASVVHATLRTATCPVELDAAHVRAGDRVHVVLGQANRDVAGGDAFDPDRDGLGDHLAFGRGAHFCPGAPLARTEAVTALRALTRLDGLRLAPGGPPERWPLPTLNALRALPVEWTP